MPMPNFPDRCERRETAGVGGVGAYTSLRGDVEKIIGHWEYSDRLASECADKLLAFIIGDERIEQAVSESKARSGERESLSAIIEYLRSEDT